MKKFFNAVNTFFKGHPDTVSDSGYTRLQRAIVVNDVAEAVSMINAGADINYRGALALPPLHFALERDRHSIALVLLNAGADIELPDATGRTPLHHAAAQAQESFVLALLKQGANPDARDAAGRTPLHVMSPVAPQMIDAFAEHKADLNAQDNDGNTPLHLFLDKPEMVERLLGNGADTNIRNNDGVSPYMMMLDEGRFQQRPDVLRQMLSCKADVKTANHLGETVLHLAARLDDADAFDTAFSARNIAATDQNGNTVLHALARTQNIPMIEKVLARAPELLHQENDFGMTPLAELCRHCDHSPFLLHDRIMATARLMIARGADPSVADEQGRTLLHHAVAQEKFDFIEFLFGHNIDPEIRDLDGQAALHIAIDKKNVDLVDILLDHGANPDLTDARGWTILDRLAGKGDRDSPVVQRLIVGGGQYQKQLPLHPDQIRDRSGGRGFDKGLEKGLDKPKRPDGGFGPR